MTAAALDPISKAMEAYMPLYTSDLSRRAYKTGEEFIVHYDNWAPGGVYRDTVKDTVDAARAFASLFARREYGKRGTVVTLREDLHREDGRWFQFNAFVGHSTATGGYKGRNILFSVTVEG